MAQSKFDDDRSGRVVIPKDYNRGTPKEGGGRKPDYRIVQARYDAEGNEELVSVGGCWKNKSEKGLDYLNVKLGGLKLVAFVNKNESKDGKPVPAYQVCMSVKNQEGKVETKQVGAMWQNKSDKGMTYYNLTIGDLRLPVFVNGKE